MKRQAPRQHSLLMLGSGSFAGLWKEDSRDLAELRNAIAAADLHAFLQAPGSGGVLLKIQSHFHEVIRGRAGRLVQEHALRLPELEPLLELDRPQMWFAVPGMYGGFGYRLESVGVEARLVSESWCRVAGGSGQRHEITCERSRLVEDGFV